jgi:hypothetical protein
MKQKFEEDGPEDAPLLPANRAFVIQFSTETEVPQGRLTGRVEHVVSGHSGHFQSLEELLDLIGHVLTAPKRGELP